MTKNKPNYCSLCPPETSIAFRVVGTKFYCEGHTDAAFAEARRASALSKDRSERISRGEWLKLNYFKQKEAE